MDWKARSGIDIFVGVLGRKWRQDFRYEIEVRRFRSLEKTWIKSLWWNFGRILASCGQNFGDYLVFDHGRNALKEY